MELSRKTNTLFLSPELIQRPPCSLTASWQHQMKTPNSTFCLCSAQLQPIHEILRRSDLTNMETKRQHLKRALDEYLQEFNACRCGPCQNDGEPILVGDTCICQCQLGYEGHACEQSKRPGKVLV